MHWLAMVAKTFSSLGLTPSYKIHEKENKDCKLQHVQGEVTVRSCVWWAAAVNPVLCSAEQCQAITSQAFSSGQVCPLSHPIYFRIIHTVTASSWSCIGAENHSSARTGCTLVHKDRAWDQRLRSNQLFLHGKHFTLHSLSIAEEPGRLQPKEFIAHSFLNLI